MKLSIIIPVFNEEKTIVEIIKRVDSIIVTNVEKEIIIVDDGSTDNSKFKIQSFGKTQGKNSKCKGIKIFSHEKNQGKGSAVRTGIQHATGDYILIQDADLEYDPQFIKKLLEPIQQGIAKVVYGTRINRFPNFRKDERTPLFFLHYLGNRILSLLTSVLYGQWITDMETGYKVFPKKALDGVTLTSRGFEFEPEITAKLLKNNYNITEIPIVTNPRNYKDGKKLNAFKEGPKAAWTLLKYRFLD